LFYFVFNIAGSGIASSENLGAGTVKLLSTGYQLIGGVLFCVFFNFREVVLNGDTAILSESEGLLETGAVLVFD